MTFLAILCALLAGAALRFYLRNLRLVAKLRQSRSRTAHLRATLDSSNKFTHDVLCRSSKRRDALVRVTQYCRESSEVMSILIAVGVEITADRNRRIAERDAVIEKMTARIAELMQRTAGAPVEQAVVRAAEHWREMRYPQRRSWRADCDEDMHLVSAVDTYRASSLPVTAPATTSCSDLDEFFDGELPAERAAAFRDHLAGCEPCSRRLESTAMLDAMVSLTKAPTS